MTVIGAIQPSTFSEPSARDIARIIRQIQQTRAPAIFGSEAFKSAILEKIAAETGVRYVSALRDDVLPGAPGHPEHSYIGMMRANVRAMVEALGGDATAFGDVYGDARGQKQITTENRRWRGFSNPCSTAFSNMPSGSPC